MAGGKLSKYEKFVRPRLSEIAEWRKNGVEIGKIADEVGVARSTFNLYIAKHKELSDIIKNCTSELIDKLHGALTKKATGFQYEETKKIYERDESGQLVHVRTEVTTKTSPPDVAAINLALKNFDRENWSNDPQALELKRRELELKEKQLEANDW